MMSYCKSTPQFLRESAALILQGYKIQFVAAFDKAASAAEVLAVIFCLAAASAPLTLIVLLGAVLCALSLRDAYTHPRVGVAQKKADPGGPDVPVPSYLDRLADTAIAAVFLLVAQVVMQQISPAASRTAFSRGACILLPLMATLRCVLRPTRAPKPSFDGDPRTPDQLYSAVWRLNWFWIGASLGVIYIAPHMFDRYDWFVSTLCGVIPPATFGVLKNIQRNRISKDPQVQEIFAAEKKHLERLRDGLLRLEKGDSLYSEYVVLEVLFFLEMAAPLAFQISPWLAGRGGDIDLFGAGFNLVMFATVLLTWNQVKATNRGAAAAIQRMVDEVEAADDSN
jgi:hypothetical protein